ncbi:MAG: TIM barrel protein [Phycisphaerales bacterium]
MMFSLNVNSIRDVLKRKGKRSVEVVDLPRYTREHLDLRAMNLSTDLLKGMGKSDIERIRDTGDKCGCTCLLLSEPSPFAFGDSSSQRGRDAGVAGIDRMKRVLTAANLLGCNAVALSIKSKDTDEALESVVDHMKQILEVADRIDINVLISPIDGLTGSAERVTELVKAIGGFRIGTNPDFQTAQESGDPAGYLRRLTPYATVVNASTLGFEEAEPDEALMEKAEGLTGLDALAAELEAMSDDTPPVHVGYDLGPLVGAVKAVGFDGTISLDYRGGGDGTLGVMQSREAIESAIQALADA